MQDRERPPALRWLLGAALTPLAPLASLPAMAQPDQVQLADNQQVLQTWQQATGADQAPQITTDAAGATVVTFQGGVLWDKYTNDISQPGGLPGGTMTPSRDGSFYKLQAQGDLRGTSADGDVSYAQMAVTSSDDRAAQSQPLMVNTFQFGRAGPGYQMAFGDVSPNFSSLGTSTSLRGALLQRQFSDRVTGAATAGVIADSWAAISDMERRTQLLRDAWGAKLDYQLPAGTGLYLTTQGYGDRSGSLPAGISAALPASAKATTAGFNYRQDAVSVQGELGASHWQEEGQDGFSDTAAIVDASWRGESLGLRAGYHRLGAHYASLAAAGGAGVKEGYVGGDWRAASWITLNADLRHSRNEAAAGSTSAQSTDSLATVAVINFGSTLPGLGWTLQYSTSNGKLDTGGNNRNDNYGTMLFYATGGWNTGLGYGVSKMNSDAATDSNGQTRSWSYNLGKSFSDPTGTWTAGAQLAASVRRQELDSGANSRDRNYALTCYGQRSEWGTLNATVTDGLTTQTTGGPDLRTRGWQVDGAHPFGKQNSVKLYWRHNSNFSGDPGLAYRERTLGLQFVLMI